MNNNSLLSHRKEEPENGTLYIVGTPIGNLNDISQRALNILQNVSLVACEDTRQTKKIMNKFNISNKLISFNKHNSSIKIPKLVKDLKEGNSIAIVSDAGMPGICDPGEDIFKCAKSEGIDVISIKVEEYGGHIVETVDEAFQALTSMTNLGSDTAVLLKGSRIAALESLATKLSYKEQA